MTSYSAIHSSTWQAGIDIGEEVVGACKQSHMTRFHRWRRVALPRRLGTGLPLFSFPPLLRFPQSLLPTIMRPTSVLLKSSRSAWKGASFLPKVAALRGDRTKLSACGASEPSSGSRRAVMGSLSSKACGVRRGRITDACPQAPTSSRSPTCGRRLRTTYRSRRRRGRAQYCRTSLGESYSRLLCRAQRIPRLPVRPDCTSSMLRSTPLPRPPRILAEPC